MVNTYIYKLSPATPDEGKCRNASGQKGLYFKRLRLLPFVQLNNYIYINTYCIDHYTARVDYNQGSYMYLLHIMCGYQCDKAMNRNDTHEVI